jgi:hypothetical protein
MIARLPPNPSAEDYEKALDQLLEKSGQQRKRPLKPIVINEIEPFKGNLGIDDPVAFQRKLRDEWR